MENVEIKIIKDKLKKFKILLAVWVVVVVLGIGLAVIGYLEDHKEVKLTYLNDLILQEDNNILKNSYLDVYTSPYVFAEYENEDSKFYIVKDSEYLYIVYLDDELYEKIASVEDIENNPYRVEGYTESIPDDVRALAIEAYNEAFEEEIVNESNFDSYFGSIYLNTNDIYNNADMFYIFAIVAGIVGLCGIFGIANANKNSKKVLSKMMYNEFKNLSKELDSEDAKKYEKDRVYFTKSYIVSLISYIDIIKYKDIVWYYKHEVRTNGIKTSQGLIVVTKDGVKHTIVMFSNSKKARAKFEEIWKLLADKLPKVLVGYTTENIKKAKELYNAK